jgi:C1A family cysteine protease
MTAAKEEPGEIYAEYGAFTTAASVIATWAVIDSTFNGAGDTMAKNSKSTRGNHITAGRLHRGEVGEPAHRLTLRRASRHGGYGWVRDLPDARDFQYAAPLHRFPQGLPKSVDLRSECPLVYDQGQLGSCTGNGIAGAIEFDQRKQGEKEFTPSRLFIYYNERVIEDTVNQDSGAQVRDGIKTVATLGAPPEKDWPYDIQEFAKKPPAGAYADAKLDLVSSYMRVSQNLTQMQGCLAEGYPFVFGFTVYESFESQEVADTGIVPMPTTAEKVVGGHCVVAVGYDDTKRCFIIRNSWGADWGIKGYCLMPYEYLVSSQLASDFWTLRSVTG